MLCGAAYRRRDFRPIWTIAAALLTVPVAITAIAHLRPSRPVGSTTSGTATVASAQQQARMMSALILTSSQSRSAVKSAVVATKACRSLPANAETFRAAASARRSQRDQAGALDVSAVASGADLVGTLVRAMHYSEQADNAFAAWATELAGGTCHAGRTTTGDFEEADRESNSATTEKKHFVAVWNPVARSYGLPRFVYSDI
jgi:hypothetical protein